MHRVSVAQLPSTDLDHHKLIVTNQGDYLLRAAGSHHVVYFDQHTLQRTDIPGPVLEMATNTNDDAEAVCYTVKGTAVISCYYVDSRNKEQLGQCKYNIDLTLDSSYLRKNMTLVTVACTANVVAVGNHLQQISLLTNISVAAGVPSLNIVRIESSDTEFTAGRYIMSYAHDTLITVPTDSPKFTMYSGLVHGAATCTMMHCCQDVVQTKKYIMFLNQAGDLSVFYKKTGMVAVCDHDCDVSRGGALAVDKAGDFYMYTSVDNTIYRLAISE